MTALSFRCADGAELRYSIAGTGEPVVLIHGLGLDAAMWDAQWPAVQREFRAIRYDVRGFGDSSIPVGPYSNSDDLLGLLDFLDARPAHVVGLSMGGRLALRFALDQPKAVKSLTLIDPALEGFRWSESWTRHMAPILAAAGAGDVHAAQRLWLAHELFTPARRDPQVAAALGAMVERYSVWHWRNTDPVSRSASPASQCLATVTCPTLVILGELDLPDFKEIARRLAAGIPGAALHTIADAGHMANMEAPRAVNDLLLAHLRANSGRKER
jgi:pimeloyl-ACP methyl ester carboxylesterase